MGISKNDFVELKGCNKEVLVAIQRNPTSENFWIKRKLSNRIIYLLLKLTAVKQLLVSERIALAMPRDCLRAVKKTGVKVILLRLPRRGRPPKHGRKAERSAKSKSLRTASKKSGVPLRTLYYYRTKSRTKNARERKSKYRLL